MVTPNQMTAVKAPALPQEYLNLTSTYIYIYQSTYNHLWFTADTSYFKVGELGMKISFYHPPHHSTTRNLQTAVVS